METTGGFTPERRGPRTVFRAALPGSTADHALAVEVVSAWRAGERPGL